MQLEWDRKVGAAAIIGLIGSLAVLVTVGVSWGQMNSKIDMAAFRAEEAKKEVAESAKTVNEQSQRLGKIETAIQFIVPAIERIESKLDTRAR